MADSSKTEKATTKKRSDERKKGNVFMSNDAITVATLLASFVALFTLTAYIAGELQHFLQLCIAMITTSETGELQGRLAGITMEGLWVVAKTSGPLLGITALAGVAATLAQTRLLVSGQLLKPKFSRINPLEGFKRVFSMRSVIEALKGTLKIAILLTILYNYVKGLVGGFSAYMNSDLGWVCIHLFEQIKSMVTQIVIAFIALAGADFLYQWWEFERKLRMSKQEIKEEYKQMEGDPQIKGKIKETQRKMAQARMMQQVPQADVVIRNPTHFAVALRYHTDTDNAPLVLAKGMDELALRIVKVAEENGVTIIENVPLARALYATAELDREIPPELYGAVAEVLVYLFQVGKEK